MRALTRSCRWLRSARGPLLAGVALLLSACWTPPSANVRPRGEPRIVVEGISIERVLRSATVESVDPSARTITLSVRGVPLAAARIGPGVRRWGDLRSGDQVRATIKELLTVYVPPADESGHYQGRVPDQPPDAHVRTVDPSYRLLEVQYPDGATETFKLALRTRMLDIEAGDAVAMRPVEVIRLRVRRRARREDGSGSGASGNSVG